MVKLETPSGKCFRRGKRVSKDCLLTYEERRAYVKFGPAACVRMLEEKRGFSRFEALALLKRALGEKKSYH